AGHEGGAVEAHPAVRQHAVAAADELRAKRADRLEPRQRRQLLVEDREVDVEAALRRGGDALIEAAFHVDDGVDAERGDGTPLADGRRDVEAAVIVDLVKRGGAKVDQYRSSSRAAARTLP